MDDKVLEVVCVTDTKLKGNDMIDLPGNRIAPWHGVPESERGFIWEPTEGKSMIDLFIMVFEAKLWYTSEYLEVLSWEQTNISRY